jgi:hypothetical protein
MPVEISGNAKILRRIHEIGDTNVYVDSNGEVHVYQKDQQIQTETRQVPKPKPQASALPLRYQPHTTSFPQGPINSIDTNSGADGIPTWLLQSNVAVQGQTSNNSSSSVKQGSRAMARRQVQAKPSGRQTIAPQEHEEEGSEPTQAEHPKRGTKAGRAPAVEKIMKKTKATKRRAEEIESDADYEKPKKIKPSPKQKKKA